MSERIARTPLMYWSRLSELTQSAPAGPVQARDDSVPSSAAEPWSTSAKRHASMRPSKVPTTTQKPSWDRRCASTRASICSTGRVARTPRNAALPSRRGSSSHVMRSRYWAPRRAALTCVARVGDRQLNGLESILVQGLRNLARGRGSVVEHHLAKVRVCLLYTSPSPRDG